MNQSVNKLIKIVFTLVVTESVFWGVIASFESIEVIYGLIFIWISSTFPDMTFN